MSLTKIYCVRHLATEWNKKNILQGSADIPILKESKSIPANLPSSISTESMPVFVSTYIRTFQSAMCYGFTNVTISSYLDEIDFGYYEGRSKDLLLRDKNAKWRDDPFNGCLKDSLNNLECRIDAFINLLKKENINECLIFGHGAWIRLAIAKYRMNKKEAMNTFIINNSQIEEIVC